MVRRGGRGRHEGLEDGLHGSRLSPTRLGRCQSAAGATWPGYTPDATWTVRSAPRCAARKISASSPAAAATSRISASPACCTRPSCGARTPTRACARIDTAAARAMARVVAVYTARDLPGVRAAHPALDRGARPASAPTAQPVFADPARALRGRGGGRGGGRGSLRGGGRRGGGAGGLRAPARRRHHGARARAGRAARVRRLARQRGRPLHRPRGRSRRGLRAAPTSWWRRGSASARVHGVPIETRGIVATPAGPDGRLTLWTSSQSPYGLRAVIAGAFGLAEEQVRVVVVDTGGGFGIKGHAYSEDLIVAAAARRLGRPVKWAESRREHFLTASPDRGQRHVARLGLTPRGPDHRARDAVHPRARRLCRERRGGDAQHHQPPARALSHPEPRGDRVQRGHPRGVRRRVPGLGAARGQLRARAADRSRGPRARHGPGRAAGGAT